MKSLFSLLLNNIKKVFIPQTYLKILMIISTHLSCFLASWTDVMTAQIFFLDMSTLEAQSVVLGISINKLDSVKEQNQTNLSMCESYLQWPANSIKF